MFSPDFLNNLKVKTKAIALLLLPTLCFLVTSIILMEGKYTQYGTAKVANELFGVSLDVSILVLSLQKERGLTEGYLGSQGKSFKLALKAQQQQTNKQIKSLDTFLNKSAHWRPFKEISDDWQNIKNELDDISSIRKSVYSHTQQSGFFEYYSNIIARIINLFQRTAKLNKDNYLSQMVHSYTILLWLNERSGQERGRINKVLSSDQLSTTTFQEISAYIALQEALEQEFNLVAPRTLREMLNSKLTNPAVIKVNKVRESIMHKLERNVLLNQLHSIIGYGGFIHSFKNYVLRAESHYRDKAEALLHKANIIIAQYRELRGMDNEDKLALDVIEKTLVSYYQNLKIVTTMHNKGYSIQEIDKTVYVNDIPALVSIDRLQSKLAGSNAEDWFKNATARIGLIDQVRKALKTNAIKYSDQLAKNSFSLLIMYVTLTIILLATVLVLGGYVVRRLTFGTDKIVNTLEDVSQKSDFTHRLLLDGNDEFSQMGIAINHHLSTLESGINSINEAMDHIGNGNFDFQISKEFNGDLNRVKEGVNKSIYRIANANKELQEALGDLNEAKNLAELARKKSTANESRVQAIIDTVLDAIITANDKGIIESFNPGAQKIFGYSVDEVLGKNVNILMPSPIKDIHQTYIERYLSGRAGSYIGKTVEQTACRKDGSIFPIELNINAMDIEGKIKFTTVIRDITKRKKSEKEIHQLAMTDQLTGLANRHCFETSFKESFKLAVRQKTNIALLIMDLDNLKSINDTEGHPTGDVVLQHISKIFKDICRETDIVARIGGDEFAIIMISPKDEKSVINPTNRIIERVSQPFKVNDCQINTSVSIGICYYPDDCDTVDELIKRADIALYDAKNSGKNKYVIYSRQLDEK